MQEQLETTLAKLISFRSISDDTKACREIIEYTKSEIEPLGLHITADLDAQHPWLIATTQETKSPKILLVAHLDVVPATDDGQYELHVDGDRLYGRGAWDMKYAAAGFLEFLKANADQLSEFDLGVLFTTDEELGGYQGVQEILRQGWRTQLAFIPDYGDNWHIEENAKGLLGVKLHAEGFSAHGSRPWEGDNAINKLVPVLHELQAVYSSHDPMAPAFSITMLQAGDAMNQIPDSAYAWIDFRAFTEGEIEAYKALLNRLTSEYGITYEVTLAGYPLVLDKENPLVQQYEASLKETGINPQYSKSFGATDGRWFAEYNIPCIVTGPHGENAHGPVEWVERQGLTTFYEILEHFLANNARVETLDESLEPAHTA